MRVWLLLAVSCLALAARLWALAGPRFDGLYGQDAYAYYYQGLALWRDHALTYHWPWLSQPTPFFWPLGEPALEAFVFAVAGQALPVLALGVSLACGVGTVALVHGLALRVAARLFTGRTACLSAALAASLMALAGLQVQASGTIMSDAPALFGGTAAIWLWTHASAGRGRRGMIMSLAAGACYALAVSIRWEYALLAPAMGMYWWMTGATVPPTTAVGGTGPPIPDGIAVYPATAGRPAVLFGLMGALLAGWPQVLYSAGHGDPVLHHQWLTGWNVAHLWQTSFATVDGVQHYPISAGAFYLVRPVLSAQSLPAPLAPFLLIGIAALAWGWGGDDAAGSPAVRRSLLALLLCWWLAPALYLAGVPFESARFTLVYSPPPAILEAVGLAATIRVSQRWRARGQWDRRIPAVLGTLWAVLSLGILAADARGPLASLARGKEADLAAVRWLDARAPAGAPIATFGLTLTLYHYGDLAGHHWTLLDLSAATPADLARAAGTGMLVIAADEGNLASQWRGLPPENALLWLEAHARMRRAGQVGGYTMFVPAR